MKKSLLFVVAAMSLTAYAQTDTIKIVEGEAKVLSQDTILTVVPAVVPVKDEGVPVKDEGVKVKDEGLKVKGDSIAKDTTEGFRFTTVDSVAITSVKDQHRSGTCWAFSTLGFLESEVLRTKGKVVEFAPMYVVSKTLMDRAT